MPSALAYQGLPRYAEFRVAFYPQVRFLNGETAEVDL